MRKFLFVLLIAIIACSTDFAVEEYEDFELQKFDPKVIVEAWKKVKAVFDKAVKFLKENDLYDPLIKAIKKYGIQFANNLCVKQHKIEETTCRSIVDFLFGLLKKLKKKETN